MASWRLQVGDDALRFERILDDVCEWVKKGIEGEDCAQSAASIADGAMVIVGFSVHVAIE